MRTHAHEVQRERSSKRPPLNSPNTVDLILRTYGSEAIRRAGEPGGLEWTLERAKQLNATFLGHGYADDIIYETGPWNTPELIGHHCIRTFMLEGEDRHGPMLALMWMANRLTEVVQNHMGEEPASFGHELDQIITKTRDALLGFPEQSPKPPEAGMAHLPGPELTTIPPTKQIFHPKVDDNGIPVPLAAPHTPTGPATWTDASAVATFLPGGKSPKQLNGIPFSAWVDHPVDPDDWNDVEGQDPTIEEPEMVLIKGKAPAAGVIIEEPDGRVWIVHPSNAHAGYRATFPKGHTEEGIDLQPSAIKRAYIKSGLKVEITGFLGDFERGLTTTRYYTARRIGGSPTDCGWESQAVSLVPRAHLFQSLNRKTDHQVVEALGLDTHEAGFAVEAPPGGKPYLGDAVVVGQLIQHFAVTVMQTHHEFLTGTPKGKSALADIEALAKRYGDIFMGRDHRYQPAPWNCPARMGGKLRFAVDSIRGDDDEGEGYFRFLALQCVKASDALNEGMAEEEAGPRLQEILQDAVNRWLPSLP